jgi:hypothetical protein
MGKMMGVFDVRYSTHQQFYRMCDDHAYDVLLIENVPEYSVQHVKKRFPCPAYGVAWEKVDPRCFGDGAARARVYILVWKTAKLKWDTALPLREVLLALSARPCMTASSYFWKDLPPSTLSASAEP